MLHMTGALVLGMAFGFVLQRGGFCGASLMSAVILERDWRGLVAILTAVLVSMAGFAFLAHMGWIVPNPNPVRLLSAIVGGAVFGTGMVLAGGCISGTLFKAGEGRLTSMLALLASGIGAAAIGSGPLASLRKVLLASTKEITWSAGLDEAVGLAYAPLAAIVAGAGLAAIIALLLAKRRPRPASSFDAKKILKGGWSPIAAGVAVGILGWLAYPMSSATGRSYPLGAYGGVAGAFSLLVGGEHKGSAWMIFLAAGMVLGSAVSALMRGSWKLRSADPGTLLIAILGGFMIGVGASMAKGCFIGNTVSGLALLSIHSVVFTACMLAANLVTTTLYLRGIK